MITGRGLGIVDYKQDSEARPTPSSPAPPTAAGVASQHPRKDQIVRALGTDGGAVCNDPGCALSPRLQNRQLVNGAAGPGTDPSAPTAVVKGEHLIIQMYCPDKLAEPPAGRERRSKRFAVSTPDGG